MSRSPELLPLGLLTLLALPPGAAAGELGLGREATPDEIAAWDIDVLPGGEGLPAGGMSAADGEAVYMQKCASCHGDFAEGVDRWPQLAGGWDTLKSRDPVKTVGSYWPYASTVWDYVHRAMPFGAAQSLTPDEVYGVTAYVLYMNDIIKDDSLVLSAETLPAIEMPNRDGFFMDPRPDTQVYAMAERCMEDCKDAVEITKRAAVLDVTPDEGSNPSGSIKLEEDADAGEGAGAGEDTEMAAAGPASALVEDGAKVFRQCAACHEVGPGAGNRVGPGLDRVVGAPAAAVEGFDYSGAMEQAAADGLAWTPENLHAFLKAPADVVPGTTMPFAGLADEGDRAAVIAYLEANGG